MWCARRWRVVLAAAMVMGAVPAAVAQKGGNTAAARTQPTKVRYEVQVQSVREATGTRNIITLPSIGLRGRFFNDSDKDVAIPLWGTARYNDIFRLEITGPDGKAVVGPAPTLLPEVLPVLPASMSPPRDASRVGDSPFVLVKAKGSVECEFWLLPGVESKNAQQWYFPRPGKYTLRAEYVNTHSSYVDSQTKAVVKMEGVFLGGVKAPPVEFNVTRSAAEGGFEISNSRAMGRGAILVLGENPAGQPGLNLAGTTLDERGQPLAGVVLEITANKVSGLRGGAGDIGDGIVRKTIDRQRSGADGKFEFADLPPNADSYVLKATPAGNYVTAVAALSNEKKISRKDLKITLQDGVSVRGKVVDPKGRPLAEVEVTGVRQTAYAEDPKLVDTGESPKQTVASVRTGADGTFQLSGITRAECRFGGTVLKQEVKASPSAGHADDGTWTVVVEPKAAAATTPAGRAD